NFPLIGDPDRKVSNLYGMIHPKANDTLTVRSVFFIDPNKKVRAMITYPASTGRNFDEILRVLDSLQLTDKYQVATPVNWKQGEDCVIVPSLTDPEELKRKFPKGYKALKPYLRMTPQPTRARATPRGRARRPVARADPCTRPRHDSSQPLLLLLVQRRTPDLGEMQILC